MIHLYRTLFFLAAVFMLGSCAVEVKTVFHPNADFKSYRTYCWMEGCGPDARPATAPGDTALENKFRRVLTEELKRKKLERTTTDPDLLIAVRVAVKDEQTVIYRRNDETPMVWSAESQVNVMSYKKGTIVVAMAERRTGTLVWESNAVQYMEVNPDMSDTNLRRAIRSILAEYPPDTERTKKRTNAIY